jgi:hypothetical protein
MRGNAIEDLDHDQREIERGRNRERRAEIFRRVDVAMVVLMTVTLDVRFIMTLHRRDIERKWRLHYGRQRAGLIGRRIRETSFAFETDQE